MTRANVRGEKKEYILDCPIQSPSNSIHEDGHRESNYFDLI